MEPSSRRIRCTLGRAWRRLPLCDDPHPERHHEQIAVHHGDTINGMTAVLREGGPSNEVVRQAIST